MFVADYVLMEYGTGAMMARPRPRPARLRVRHGLRSADPPGGGAGRRRGPDISSRRSPPTPRDERLVNSGEFTAWTPVAGRDAIVAWLDGEGQRPRVGQLPPARLAHLPPALLGLPDPDRLLRAAAAWCPVPESELPVSCPTIEDYQPTGPLAAGRGRGLGQHHVPAVRRPGAPRDRHDGHLRRLQLVLPALLRRPQRHGAVGPAGAGVLDAGGPVHRRGRARDPAPDVRALLRQGAGRHGSARRPGAVPGAVHAGDDPRRRRQQDVQVSKGNVVAPSRSSSASAPTPPAATCCSSGPLEQDAAWSDTGVAGRAQVPLPAVAAGRRAWPRRRGRSADAAARRRPRATR